MGRGPGSVKVQIEDGGSPVWGTGVGYLGLEAGVGRSSQIRASNPDGPSHAGSPAPPE
jgi:hypothetical protein